MGDFRKGERSLTLPDPFKRVHYRFGMVMGVDEFEQEQAYFLARGHQHNLSLHGYGTAWGLKVTAIGSRILISPGLAISPRGREIRVATPYEAELNQWLGSSNHFQMVRRAPMHGGHCACYVLLRPLTVGTDPVNVPVTPGHPPEAKAASRILDTFEILFSLKQPSQWEEEAVRQVGALLSRIQVTKDRETVTPHQVAAMVRALGAPTERADGTRQQADQPLEGALYVHPDHIDTFLQTIIRVWVTEVRPSHLPDDLETGAQAETDVLIARLEFQLNAQGEAYDIHVVEEERPLLVETRLLREFVMRSRETLIGAAFQPTTEVSQLQGRNISSAVPKDGAILVYNSRLEQWEPRMQTQADSLEAVTLPAMAFVTITKVAMDRYSTFELWFHLRTGNGRDAEAPILRGPIGFEVYAEGDQSPRDASGRDGLVAVPIRDLIASGRNRYEVVLEGPANTSPHLRFQFYLDTMRLDNGQSVSEWMQGHPERWLDYGGQAMVTAFHYQAGIDTRLASWAVAAVAENQTAAGSASPQLPVPRTTGRQRVPHKLRRTLRHRAWPRRAWDWVFGK
jgi:hypothetical protein